jgi:hypothetical protein
MPGRSPICSVNDFVVRFANVNGSGSASANELSARAVLRMNGFRRHTEALSDLINREEFRDLGVAAFLGAFAIGGRAPARAIGGKQPIARERVAHYSPSRISEVERCGFPSLACIHSSSQSDV